MSQRRSRVMWRWRAPDRRSIKRLAARQASEGQQLPDEAFRDADGRDAGLGEEDGLNPRWQGPDVSESVVEVLVTQGCSRQDPPEVAEDEGTSGTERLIQLYLQEARAVQLLTAADEVRLAEQLHTAKAHLLEALQANGLLRRPTHAIPSISCGVGWMPACC